MRKSLLISCGILVIVLSLAFIAPVKAATSWGVEVDDNYKFELKTLKMLGTDFSAWLKDNTTMTIEFTGFNSTGYTYDAYNSTGHVTPSSTNFEEILIETVPYTMPVGLPVALPLELGTIPDYLLYYGQVVNSTASLLIIEDLLANITDYLNVTYTGSHSLLNEAYLHLYFDLYAPEVNASILLGFISEDDMGGFTDFFPSYLTDFKLNASISFNATSGLFTSLSVKIRSLEEVSPGNFEPFDLDLVYGVYIPPVPYTPPPEDTSYSWIIPSTAAFVILGSIFSRKRKQNS